MIKKFTLLFCATLAWQVSYADVEQVKTKLKSQYPQLSIENLQPTESSSLYSGTLNNQIIYVDEDAQHLFYGSMFRIKDQKNLTQDLMLQQHAVDFKKLPLQDAIKTVRGNGKHQLAIFSDPNCPYCKTLESNLAKLNDVTIYTFMYPIKTQSVEPSKKVWCSANKEYAWKALIQRAEQPKVTSDCAHPIDRNLQLGQQLKLQGTPVIIFENGFKLTGAYPAEDIKTIWKEFNL